MSDVALPAAGPIGAYAIDGHQRADLVSAQQRAADLRPIGQGDSRKILDSEFLADVPSAMPPMPEPRFGCLGGSVHHFDPQISRGTPAAR